MRGDTMISRFEQFSAAISSIYKYIQKIEREETAKYDLKGPHVQCLVALRRSPEGLTASQLCDACDKDKAAISRTVSELEKKGLLCREGNSYRHRLRLTVEGMQVACGIGSIVESAVERAGRGLSEENRKVFYDSLELIASNLHEISEEGLPTVEMNVKETKTQEC